MRIPTLPGQTVESRPIGTPYDSTRPTPSDFGADVGEGLSVAARQAAAIFADEKRKADVDAALKATTDLDAFRTTLLFGAPDGATKGAFAAEGEDAIAASQTALDAYDKRAKEMEGALQNDAQRRAFRDHALPARAQTYAELMRHERTEVAAAQEETYRTAVKQGVQDASLYGADPAPGGGFELALAKLDKTVSAYAAAHGKNPAWIEYQAKAQRGAAYVGAIQTEFARRSPEGNAAGRTLLEQARAGHLLDPETEARFVDVAQRIDREEQTFAAADAILPVNSPWSPQVRDAARESVTKVDPQVRGDVERMVEVRLARAKDAYETTVTDAFDRVHEFVRTHGTTVGASPADLALVAKDARAQDGIDALLDRLRIRDDRERTLAEKADEDQRVEAYGRFLFDVATNPTRYEQMGEPEFKNKWFQDLGRQRYAQALSVLAATKKPDNYRARDLALIMDTGQRSGDFPKVSGIGLHANDPGTWPEAKARVLAVVQDEVEQVRGSYASAHNGAQPPDTLIREYVQQRFARGVDESTGFLGLGKKEVSVVGAQLSGHPFTPRIPAEFVEGVKKQIKAAGAPPPTDAEIDEEWGRRQRARLDVAASGRNPDAALADKTAGAKAGTP